MRFVVAVIQWIVCWLIRRDATVQTSSEISPATRNMKKYFAGVFFSTDFRKKNYSKTYRSESPLNYRSSHSAIKLTQTT